MKRHLVLIAPLLLAACDSGPEWRNQQAELANELNPPEPAAEEVAATEPAANDANAVTNSEDVNAVTPETNETAPPPAD